MPTHLITNNCYVCQRDFSSARYLIQHLKGQHQIHLNTRPSGYSRPRKNGINYIYNAEQMDDSTVIKMGCPSCWFECDPDSSVLQRHVEEKHIKAFDYEPQQKPEPYQKQRETTKQGTTSDTEDEDEPSKVTDASIKSREKELMDRMDDLVNSVKRLFNY